MSQKMKLNFNLSDIADGGAQEKFEHEMQRIAENILDPNTDAKKKRVVTLTITFEPNDNRDVVSVSVEAKSKLAPENGIVASMMLGRNDAGYIEAAELKSGAAGQTYFDIDDETVKTDTGVPVEEAEKKSSKVVDLQAKNKA